MPPQQAKCLPQIVWVRRFSHRFHRIHRNSCWGYSPTDFTDLHRLLGCLQGGALVSSAPTEQEVHQRSYVGALETSAPPEVSSFCVNLCNLWEALCCCGGKDTSATIFRSLTICVNLCNLWEDHCLLGWCTSCLVGALETSAPPKISSFCVNLCNLWETIPSKKFCEICVFCGRTSPTSSSV